MKLKKFIKKHNVEFSVFSFMVALLLIFILVRPQVFLNPSTFQAIFTVYPILLILACSLVFVIASGDSDLSFPGSMGVSLWIFAWIYTSTGIPVLGLICALSAGLAIGLINGLLITKLKLSSLVVTLGMNFLLRGLIMIGTDGMGIQLVALKGTLFHNIFVGRLFGWPVQLFWGLGIMIICHLLFKRHQFGAHVCYSGDNRISARETGVKVDRVKIGAYMLMGCAAAMAGVFSGLINNTFWPTTGDGYLLTTMAATYLGGTPTWGGVGTIIGAAMGAFILSFMETGIIASGLTGFYTQFFFGFILVLALISHKFSGMKRKGGD
ncbi:MAG: ABC transporter permease [Bacillota bacterium]